MDFDLLEAIDKVRHLEPFLALQTKVMSPEQLGKLLKLQPVSSNLLSYHNASYPVRPDLSQPNNRRTRY